MESNRSRLITECCTDSSAAYKYNFLTSFSECLRNDEGVMGIELLAAIYRLI